MGQVLHVVTSICKLECCDNFNKYVLNAMDVKSKCCNSDNCFECEFQTEKVDIASDSSSEYSVEVGNCCRMHKE